jgi:hypothetical protein
MGGPGAGALMASLKARARKFGNRSPVPSAVEEISVQELSKDGESLSR